MRKFLLILTCVLAGKLHAQQTAAELSAQLTANLGDNTEKVRAIFSWITKNIAYHTRPKNFNGVIGPASRRFIKGEESDAEEEDENAPLLPLNDRVAATVIKRRTAVCDGYARLFQSMCEYAGVRSVIIPGFARNAAVKPLRKFMVNHYWNAVYIDSSWRLLDVTWASGYISGATGEFVREYDAHYFFTPPVLFAKDHFPADPAWSLMNGIGVPEEMRSMPFKQKAFGKYAINSYSPSSGIIMADVGDTIHLALQTKYQAVNIVPDLVSDSIMLETPDQSVYLKPVYSLSPPDKENVHHYQYTVASTQSHWLYLLYNDDRVLRYLVYIKKKKA